MFLNVVLTRTSKQKFEKHEGQIKMRRDKKKMSWVNKTKCLKLLELDKL